MKTSKRSKNGSCFIECIVGGLFLVVSGLFVLDGVGILLATSVHDKVVANAARAAARADANADRFVAQPDRDVAEKAAQDTIRRHPANNALIQNIKLVSFNYYPRERVEVTTRMTVGLPAPLPGLPKTVTFEARSISPMVSIAPISLKPAG